MTADGDETPWWWHQELIDGEDCGRVIEWIDLPQAEQARLLEALRDTVPQREVVDGIESQCVPLFPDEIAEPHLREAALILALGELEAAVQGEPPSEADEWTELRPLIDEALRKVLDAEDVLKTPPLNSQLDHARHARERLRALDFLENFYAGQMPDPEDAAWIREVIREVSFNAFHLGRRFQVVTFKPFEPDAVSGAKSRKGSSIGGEMRKGWRAPKTQEVLRYMKQYLVERKTEGKRENISAAARAARRAGLGTSEQANRKLYHLSKKSCDTSRQM